MTWQYLRHALVTAFRVARFDPKAIADFDQSFEGFFRSFFGIVLCAPIYGVILVAERRVADEVATQLPGLALAPLPPPGASVYFTEALAYLANWLALPLAMIVIVRLIGVSARYVPFVVAYNWGACLVLAVTVVPYIFYLAGLIPFTVLLVLYYPVTVFALVYRWRIARDGLQTNGWNAAGVVIFDVLLSILVAMAVGRIQQGLTGA